VHFSLRSLWCVFFHKLTIEKEGKRGKPIGGRGGGVPSGEGDGEGLLPRDAATVRDGGLGEVRPPKGPPGGDRGGRRGWRGDLDVVWLEPLSEESL